MGHLSHLSPLITILSPEREIDIVNALINIYQRDGYMPDARSGNANRLYSRLFKCRSCRCRCIGKKAESSIDYELALKATS